MSGLHDRVRHRDERGDTLIEVLLAVVIIALAAGPLIGALLESIAASAEHRGIATTGTVLESFAETAVSEIETSPVTGTAYQATATPSYRLLSNPSKPSGPVGTNVTVFVTGFPSAPPSTVKVGGVTTSPPSVTRYGPTTGDARITFTIPTLTPSPTPYPITVTGVTSLKGTGFRVTTTASQTPVKTPYKGYEITLASIKCWTTGGQFVPCETAVSPTDLKIRLQYLTFSGTGSSGSLGSLGVVVRDPNRT